ncbi:MAG: helix-turn-helix transcriptional regulator [Nitrospinae bacterium]|nr:helix-turn-helix transcriptional regulator [Nitrospinota bacterium]
MGEWMVNVSNKESGQQSSMVLENIANNRSVPGVVSLTGAMCLLFMNAEAEALCHQVVKGQGESGNGSSGNEALPQEIHELCAALQQEMEAATGSPNGEEIQLRRFIGEEAHPILLRGFFIPGNDENEPRYLILMEKLGRRIQPPTDAAKKHFHLTDRELEIIMHVADGKTNREIAELLDISEHTVKEHIKHVFKKTGSSTRTGILAQIFRFA